MLQALGSRPVARDRRSTEQASQRCGHALAVAAVVAGHKAARAMQHQSDITVGAAPHAPARAAGQEVRPAAAIEQHDRLGARASAPRSGPARASGAGAGCASSRMSNTSHARQRTPVDAAAGASSVRTRLALSARGVALPSSSTRAAAARPLGRNVTGVIARVALVLVGGIVLLVDDDQAEVARSVRTRPSEGRRRCARRPRAAAAIRHSARPGAAASASRRPSRRSVR